jgi:hypothetical protein
MSGCPPPPLDISPICVARDTSYVRGLTRPSRCGGARDTNNLVSDARSNAHDRHGLSGTTSRRAGGPIPLGFRLENGRRVEEPVGQRLLALIRHRVEEENYSFGAVADLLNRYGVRAARGGPWTAQSVRATYLTDAGRRLRTERDSLVERVRSGRP